MTNFLETPYAQTHHTHNYVWITSFDFGHLHQIVGTTGPGILTGRTHVHYYQGVTSFNDGHVHYYRGVSGPAIHLPGGGHIHYYRGITSVDFAHAHRYGGRDSLPHYF